MLPGVVQNYIPAACTGTAFRQSWNILDLKKIENQRKFVSPSARFIFELNE
jgi:hypothetical protein